MQSPTTLEHGRGTLEGIWGLHKNEKGSGFRGFSLGFRVHIIRIQ